MKIMLLKCPFSTLVLSAGHCPAHHGCRFLPMGLPQRPTTINALKSNIQEGTRAISETLCDVLYNDLRRAQECENGHLSN